MYTPDSEISAKLSGCYIN